MYSDGIQRIYVGHITYSRGYTVYIASVIIHFLQVFTLLLGFREHTNSFLHALLAILSKTNHMYIHVYDVWYNVHRC